MASVLPFPLPAISIRKPSSLAARPCKGVQASHGSCSQIPSKSNLLQRVSSLCKDGQLAGALSLLAEMDLCGLPVGPEIYGELLQGCVYERALSQGRQIHARILKGGALFYRNEYIETKLLIFYAKCDCLDIAEELFRRQRRRNVFSWAAVIGLNCRLGSGEKALVGFREMMEGGEFPDNFVIPNALKACSTLEFVGFGKGIHSYALKMGFANCIYVLSSLVDFYGKCGLVDHARKIFDDMPEKNVVTWNSMLVSYFYNGLFQEVLKLFHLMRTEGVQPSRVTISSFLSASGNLDALHEGKQGHAVSILNGLQLDNILGSSIINFYCKVGLVEEAELIFSRMADKDVVTWNLLISGYVKDGQFDKALSTSHEMIKDNYQFDCVTLASIISASANSRNLKIGKAGHGYSIRNNLESDIATASSLVGLYASCGRIEHARQVFDLIYPKNVVLWNSMISAYAQHGMSGQAWKLFFQMQLENIPPNVVSWNSVILGFLRNGLVNEAKDVFTEMQVHGARPDAITWATLVYGLAQNGCVYEAIKLYNQMQSLGFKPCPSSIVGAILACTNMVSLTYGRVIHGQVMRQGLLSSHFVATSLIDMYAKCGSIDLARTVFGMVPDRKLPLYNALLSGYSFHGQAGQALQLYRSMCHQGIKPDEITFTCLLSAFSHGGFVEGFKLFSEMVSIHHITPRREHYGCLVTMLACSASINEALYVISSMSIEPDAHVLGSLLAACLENHELELGEYLLEHLFNLEAGNSGNYVMLANTYAASGRWQEASGVRALVRQNVFVTNPACSWIQVGTELYAFVADDPSVLQLEQMVDTLWFLHKEMKLECTHMFPSTILMDTIHETLCY